MMDPFQLGLLTLTGAQNPEMMAKMMASQGVSPAALAPAAAPNTAVPFAAGDLGSLMNPVATPAAPVAAGPDPAMTQLAGIGAGMGAVKAPEPVKPIMNAGVSGSQKAPEMNVKQASGGSQAVDAMMAALLGGRTQVPNLAALLKGVG